MRRRRISSRTIGSPFQSVGSCEPQWSTFLDGEYNDDGRQSMASAVRMEAGNGIGCRAQSCPLCGGRDLCLEFPGVRDRLGIVDGEFDFYRCADCESVSLIPMPDEDEIPAFYSETYKVEGPPKGRGLGAKLRVIEWLTLFEPV